MSEPGSQTPAVRAPTPREPLITPTRANAQVIYVLMLAGVISGGVTSVVAVALAYLGRTGAAPWLDSHYEFIIRTFWFGAVYCFVSGTLFSVAAAIAFGVSLVDGLVGGFVLVRVTGALVAFGALVWWVARCAQGLDLISRDQPVANPKTWLFAR